MAEHSMRATIHDVAKKAGVSSATASRVLSGSDYPVSKTAKERILAAAASLNYKPNLIGKTLRKSVSRDIGLILPNISNPFYSELALGAETAANLRGFGLLLCNSLRSELREKEYLEFLSQKQVGGVILATCTTDPDALKRLFHPDGPCVVALDQPIPDLAQSYVNFQTKSAAKQATSFLIEHGHRRIALISSPVRTHSRKEVLRGYRSALLEADIPTNPNLELFASIETELQSGEIYEFENGKLLADRLLALSERPTAVLCVNDITAAGVIQRLSERGISVPSDLSVMGIDNTSISRIVSPALTTVDQSPFDAGMKLAFSLIDALCSDSSPREVITIEPRIVMRNSVQTLI